MTTKTLQSRGAGKSETFKSCALTESLSSGCLARSINNKGWELAAYCIDFHGQQLEFIQVNHPDGTSSYFRKGAGREIEAGPFGGGMSWTVPKYVVKAAHELFFETFKEETVPA